MKTGQRGVISGINITPLTDIFLVLLIIMMLLPIIEMKELQINIHPATTEVSDPKNPPKTFKMSVLPERFTVQKKDVESAGLVDALKDGAKDFPEGLVIEVSPDSRHEQLAQALASAKLAQISKVAVQRAPKPGQEKTAASPKAPSPKSKPAAKAK